MWYKSDYCLEPLVIIRWKVLVMWEWHNGPALFSLFFFFSKIRLQHVCNARWTMFTVLWHLKFPLSKLVNKRKQTRDVCNLKWGKQIKSFPFCIHSIFSCKGRKKEIYTLIAQFPIIIFGPRLKQVKNCDKKKEQKSEIKGMYTDCTCAILSIMILWIQTARKLDKRRQHTELCRSECLKSKKNRRLLGDMCKQIHSVAQPDRLPHTHQHTYRAVNELELIFDH